MANHPINGLMETAMQSIKDMVDVNTIIGDPVQTPDGFVILPISKVSFGLAAGGGEYYGDIDFSESTKGNSPLDDKLITPVKYPFAGGSGAGVCITPVAFMVVGGGDVQLLPVTSNTVAEQLVKMIPDLVNRVNNLIAQNREKKEQEEFDELNI
ncbi:MAG TPA: sporulation protein YtfJ [Clostridiaceae bacterium]|jgi:sporulation protein YtfJ|nr:sporulation protein YtfJ [Clostridiaceae bacterium]HOA31688.1 GerW family sporulation protein [Clostridia bacterium]